MRRIVENLGGRGPFRNDVEPRVEYTLSMMVLRSLVLPICISSFGFCCVSQSTYDAAVSAAHKQASSDEAAIAQMHDALASLTTEGTRRDKKISELNSANHNLQVNLDEATAINQRLRDELTRLGKDVDTMLAEKGMLTDALKEAKNRLKELRRAQDAAERRAVIFKQLADSFKKMTDAGILTVVLRDGRLVLQLANDTLFETARVELRPAGIVALKEVASALKSIADRRFQVSGHTDNAPLASVRYPSNWELSAARAVEIVKVLVAAGVKPGVLSAAGYGEFDPIALNSTADGKAKNRRIEITMQPNGDELIALPESRSP
ncbi:MAG: OmpA family protein [Polyangiales bacterium]